MTLALAVCCQDGIVLAADSQSTLSTQGQPTKQDAEKLRVLHKRIGWAGSGTVGAIQRVEPLIEKHGFEIVKAFEKSHDFGAAEVLKRVNAVQKEVASETIGDASKTASSYLFAGYGQDGQFVLEIGVNGVRQWCAGFTAIGSGDIFAVHAIRSLAHYNLPSLTLVQTQALVYRMVDNAIATAAYGLGGAIQLATVTKDAARVLSTDEVAAVADVVDIWKQKEVEILGQLGAAADVANTVIVGEPPAE